MKQQINLYLPEFRIVKDSLTALLMVQLLAAVVVIMVLISSYDVFTRWRLTGVVAVLQQSLQEETRKTEQLSGTLAQRSQNQELSNRLDRAEALLDSSRQVRDFFSDAQLGNVTGFSEYFKDLSRASFDGLSISEFTFGNGGRSATIMGQVVASALVPRYVANFENGSSPLRVKNFSTSMSRAEASARYLNFELSTASE